MTRLTTRTLTLAALALCPAAAHAAIDYGTNIALNTNSATPIMGYASVDNGTYGLTYANGSGGAQFQVINNGTITAADREDTFLGDKDLDENGFYDFVGVTWSTPKNNVAAVRLHHYTFGDGGWFDYPGLTGSIDTDLDGGNGNQFLNISIAPRVQYTTDGVNWLTVTGGANDYSTIIPSAPPAQGLKGPATFTFTPVSGVVGIRVFGDGAMHSTTSSNTAGFIGVVEFEAFADTAVPEPASAALIGLGVASVLLCRRAS